MQTVYYNHMRKMIALVVLAAASLSTAAQSPTQDAPKTTPMKAAFTDTHEGMTIGVEPWTQASLYKQKFPKKSPFSGGVAALQMTFRNDSDESIKIDVQSIRLLLVIGEDNRQELSPLTAEDVADTVLLSNNGKDPTQRRNPLPIPVGKPRPSRDKNWVELKDACQNAGVPSSVVAAHSTLEGLVYFDLRSEWDLLQTAKVYVPSLASMSTRRPLSYFEIDLSHGARE
ncbi:MAG TPA: hypothetical protein VGF61_01420 [Candidatus Acidoferrum sp.]|jgi:hypothetical protein